MIRHETNRAVVLALCLAGGLPACNGPTLRVTPNMGDLHAIATSADVRLVLTKPVDPVDADYVRPKTITCAEPSPDMARIVTEALGSSSSLSVKGKLPGSPTPEQLNATMALSKSHAEAIAQMTERLATIQLLRDGLYRACEAYANGAISSTTYAIILSRFDKMMVTMLFGELAAGNFGRPLATLTGTAAGKAEADLVFPTTTSTTTTTVPPSTAPSTTSSAAPPGGGASSGRCDDPSEDDDPDTTTPTTTTPSTTVPPAPAPAPKPAGKPSASAKPTSQQPDQNSKTKTDAGTTADAAGKISKYSSDAATKIAGDLVQMQANYINDQNAEALKVACLSSLGREEPWSDPNEPPVTVRGEVFTYDDHGVPRAHTVYRYKYRRALSVFCDELLESLGREEAVITRYNMKQGNDVEGKLEGLIAAGSKNAIGPLTPTDKPKGHRKPRKGTGPPR